MIITIICLFISLSIIVNQLMLVLVVTIVVRMTFCLKPNFGLFMIFVAGESATKNDDKSRYEER